MDPILEINPREGKVLKANKNWIYRKQNKNKIM